ncbi:hypothetical protein [Enterovirga rhinocerotis]|uniref:hypothetical protein n=1 Tax=Enterovirga rhinocerotis TaxID=1339210 RepID=UPI00105C89C5|nr:hypothetical protein [Enterovirga rhinocerotis]
MADVAGRDTRVRAALLAALLARADGLIGAGGASAATAFPVVAPGGRVVFCGGDTGAGGDGFRGEAEELRDGGGVTTFAVAWAGFGLGSAARFAGAARAGFGAVLGSATGLAAEERPGRSC